MSSAPNPLDFLLQTDVIERLLPTFGKEQWQYLYLNGDDKPHQLGQWSALLEPTAVAKAMQDDSWDLLMGDGRPGFVQSWENGENTTTYHPYSDSDGIRPLVLYREFSGAFPRYRELIEEFRLFHNLAEDKNRGLLLAFDESGREIDVVRITEKAIQVRLKYLRQFQAAAGLYLALYFDSVRFSTIPMATVPTSDQYLAVVDNLTRWHRVVRSCDFGDGYSSFSRMLGKVILAPPTQDKAGIWPYGDQDAREVAFIVGVDADGNDVEYTSSPEKLGNYFGAKPEAPYYLTPVYFRREVLTKYYAEPDRYTVTDGLLSCLGLWQCRIDNDLESYVTVYLGDLGRDLPYQERLHWRQFNVPPDGPISEANFKRSFLGQFAGPQSPDLVFRDTYIELNQAWEKTQGWRLFLAPLAGDAHLLITVRIPLTNSSLEFDEQLMNLTKLLVDSLNEKELAKRAGGLPPDTKGIGKMEAFLDATKFPEKTQLVTLLRDLQTLRSTGAAHRKDSRYEETIARFGGVQAHRPTIIRNLLETGVAALNALRLYYCSSLPIDDHESD